MKCRGSDLVVSLAVAALLGGCASAPVPKDAKTPWVVPKAAQKNQEAWDVVRAQKIDFVKPLALFELADIALQNNPATAKAWNDSRMAAEQVTQAQGYFLPEIKVTGSGNRQRTAATPDTFDVDYTKYGPGLQVNYLIMNFGGGRGAAVEQALQTVYAADFAFNKSIQDVLLAVETAYYGVISAEAVITAADSSVKDAEKTLEIAAEKLKQGVGTELERLQAQAGYDQALFSKANAEGVYKTACGMLAQSMGVPADTEIQLVKPAGEVPEAPGEVDMKKMIDNSIRSRPDIAALRATLAAKQAAIDVARAAYWPSLYLNGAVSRDYFDVSTGKMQDSDWSFGGTLSLQWTLFDGFRNSSGKNMAIAQAAAAMATLRQAELAASADVWIRYHNYETALQKYRFSTAFLKSASASHEVAADSYKAQLISILDLLNAETLLAQARTQNVAARQEVFTTLANLAYSTGQLENGKATETVNLFQK